MERGAHEERLDDGATSEKVAASGGVCDAGASGASQVNSTGIASAGHLGKNGVRSVWRSLRT